MAVRYDDGAHLFPVFQQVGEVRDYQIHTQQIISREHQSGVDDQNIVAIADGHHIHAEFPEPAQGDHFHCIFSHIWCRSACIIQEAFIALGSVGLFDVLVEACSFAAGRLPGLRSRAGQRSGVSTPVFSASLQTFMNSAG